jgi:hypothetical protein
MGLAVLVISAHGSVVVGRLVDDFIDAACQGS